MWWWSSSDEGGDDGAGSGCSLRGGVVWRGSGDGGSWRSLGSLHDMLKDIHVTAAALGSIDQRSTCVRVLCVYGMGNMIV